MLKGPLRPTWTWFLEVSTEALRRHLRVVFETGNVQQARQYLDCFTISYPEMPKVAVTSLEQNTFRGDWFLPPSLDPDRVLLYFHGGGYSFYPKAYSNFIAQVATTARSRTFALDYRLSPEHRFPAQLEDALACYRWMLAIGCSPERIVFAGDSAGGHLALTSLLALRECGLPLPAFIIALSPATDFAMKYPSLRLNQPFDWIEDSMLAHWSSWFCHEAQRCDPRITLLQADLHGWPPIYIQAGEVEILSDSIRAFADHARAHGADVVLESWRDMNHVFQMFAPEVPQSVEALRRLAEVLDLRLGTKGSAETLSNRH
jgi:acetyl esterase/lipase